LCVFSINARREETSEEEQEEGVASNSKVRYFQEK
jgi:hypothetical protein